LGMEFHWKKGILFLPFGIFRYSCVDVIMFRAAFCTLWSCDQSMPVSVWISACLCRSRKSVSPSPPICNGAAQNVTGSFGVCRMCASVARSCVSNAKSVEIFQAGWLNVAMSFCRAVSAKSSLPCVCRGSSWI
jgi:hypothetical protein